MLWLLVFFIVPTVMVILISFRASDPWGNIAPGWNLEAYLSLRIPSYAGIIWRTLWLSIWTTLICLFLGIPVAYSMARMPRRRQQNILLLLIVPFWTNFLIRIYAWKVLLHPDGLIKMLLVSLNLVQPDATLLYTEGAVLLVLVYSYLPFAILPLYSAAEKFDFYLLEAARDLGASQWTAFRKVFLPGISAGIISAIMVVFIPALGSYIIPEIVGGPASEMLGNKIAQRVFIDRNLPRASALSSVLILIILLPSLVSLGAPRRNRDIGGRGTVL
jgi:spermidine/putrescine transport system permease protein